MRILIRTSRLAIWARRCASFAVPLIIVPAIFMRTGLIEAGTFDRIELAAALLAVFAVALAIAAFVRLWFTGDQGWGRATVALFVGLVCLAPFGYFGYLLVHYPQLPDVSTDLVSPPALLEGTVARPNAPEAAAELATAFPNVRTRRYQLGADAAFLLVQNLVNERHWQVVALSAPADEEGQGSLNAVTTELLGWRDEIAIRVASGFDGTAVDMRSVSLDRSEDFGANGQRVEEFLTALDAAVTRQRLQATPTATAPEDEGGSEEDTAPAANAVPEG